MGRHDISLEVSGQRTALASGLYASTPVQTPFGWRRAADLGPGDLVLAQDLGLVPIAAVHTEFRQALWSVRIPAGAFGNSDIVILPPGQPIQVRTAYALPFSGDDLAMVPATALEGWCGIAPHVPAANEPILQLKLDRPGILFVGPGLLAGCDGMDEGAFDLARLLDVPQRPVLPLAAARHLVAQLVAQEAGDGFRGLHATALRPPNLS